MISSLCTKPYDAVHASPLISRIAKGSNGSMFLQHARACQPLITGRKVTNLREISLTCPPINSSPFNFSNLTFVRYFLHDCMVVKESVRCARFEPVP